MTDEKLRRPLYARLLRLRHIHPGASACFFFLEGSIALAGLLVLAGLVSAWALIVLPFAVAAAVKLNDVVAGGLARAQAVDRPPRRGRAPARNDREG